MARSCGGFCGGECGGCASRSCQRAADWLTSTGPQTPKGAKKCGACSACLLLFALALVIQAFIIPNALHNAVVSSLQKAVVLDDMSSDNFQRWANNSDNPLLLSAYVYDIQNAEEVLQGAKPHIVEKGPYVYKQYVLNFGATFADIDGNPSNVNDTSPSARQTLFYRTYSSYEFVPELSVEESDAMSQVTTLNMPFVSVRAYYAAQGLYATIEFLFTNRGYEGSTELTRLFTNRTVHEVLFGWHDDVVDLLDSQYRGFLKNFASLDDFIANDTYSTMYWNQIYTGAVDQDRMRVRNFIQYHNQSFIATCPAMVPTDNCWKDEQIEAWNTSVLQPGRPLPPPDSNITYNNGVAELRGNDGSVFPTPITDQSTPTLFYSPLLRTLDLEFRKTTTYKDVPVLQFGLPANLYKNAAEYPPNAAFSMFGPSGLLNESPVQGTIPIYVSQPRFFQCDRALIDSVEAEYLEPADADHVPATYFDVDPDSGVTMHVQTASQVDIYIDPLHGLPNDKTWFKDLKPVYMPVMWAMEEGGIDSDDAKLLDDARTIMMISKVVGLAGGIVVFIIAFTYLFLSWRALDLDKERHVHAVRSLMDPHKHGSSSDEYMAAPDAALAPSNSIMDSSVLIMRSASPHANYNATNDASASGPNSPRRKISNLDDVDISYDDTNAHRDGFQSRV